MIVTVRDYLVINPIKNIFDKYKVINDVKDEDILTIKQLTYFENYLSQIWIQKYLDFALRVSIETMLAWFTSTIWDSILSLSLSYRQYEQLINNKSPLMFEKLGVITEVNSDDSQNYTGIITDIEYSKNNNKS
ncbi:MAG: hypothetical protein ACRCXE_03310, partial [Metamycoplasmataceae bacterium]